jgi:nucleoside phosphorylase
VGVVAVLAPMRTELAPVVRRLRLRRDPRDRRDRPDAAHPATWSGPHHGHDVVAAVAGVGPRHSARVAAALLASVRPDHLVVAGVAGGLAPALAVGDVVVPAVVRDLDTGETWSAHGLGRLTLDGELVTSGVLHGWDVLEAEAGAGTLAVDMETSAIAAACERAGVPWTAIRGLSDVVREGTVDTSTLELVREDGATDLAGVARHLARHPGRLRAMTAMGRDAGRATRAVADRLAEALGAEPPSGGPPR